MSERKQHIFHSWLNRQETHPKNSPTHELNPLYVWKDAMSFREHGHHRIKQAFEGTLPSTHRQCSHSPVEAVMNNKLRCCLGKEVIACPYVLSLKAEFERHWSMPKVECSGYDPGAHYRKEVSIDDMYRSMGKAVTVYTMPEPVMMEHRHTELMYLLRRLRFQPFFPLDGAR